MYIEDITREFMWSWQDKLWSSTNDKGEFYSYAYLIKIRTYTNTFFSWAEQRYNVKNHLNDIKKPIRRTPKNTMEIWTRDEFERFISVVDDPLYYAPPS